MLKAIETIYNQNKFRSRLEARWAVALTELGITYCYETEGYDLGAAGQYLPDFYLPDSETYVEIKPQKPSDEEIEKAREMHRQSGKDVVIIYGDCQQFEVIVFPENRISTGGKYGAIQFIKYLAYCQLRKSARLLLTHLDCLSAYPEANPLDLNSTNTKVLAALKTSPAIALAAAQQAQFEHGRNGK